MKTVNKKRASNIELLRLLAMFLVLVVHADFFSIGAPVQEDTIAAPINTFFRFFFESMSIVCVNVFVLISGWFGIRPKASSFCNFIFQCLFFLIGIYVVLLLLGLTTLSVRGLAGCLVMLEWNWFIKAYIGLYILAPVLNAFADNADRETYKKVLWAFFIFQTIYSWVCNGAVFFEGGYSTMSFIGLYLLARYLNLYPLKKITPPICIGTYCVVTIILTIIGFLSMRLGFDFISGRMYSYVNPLVIVSALSLLLFFNGIKLKNRFVNWCAASCFAIFLLHTNPNICLPYFKPFVLRLYSDYNGVECLLAIFVFLFVVGLVSILIDQIRKVFWKVIAKNIFKK